MINKDIKLELIKLCYRHDRSAEDTISKAQILVKYVLEDKEKLNLKPSSSKKEQHLT